jgi:hypothetical protein
LRIRNIRLYWRLREPGFRAALGQARQLGMGATAHAGLARTSDFTPARRAAALAGAGPRALPGTRPVIKYGVVRRPAASATAPSRRTTLFETAMDNFG